jgi:adenosine kinase
MKIKIFGSLAYDNIITSDKPFNEILDTTLEHQIQGSFYTKTLKKEFGGCAGNIAYSLKLLNLDSSIYTSLGENDCDIYLNRLKKLNIDISNISIVKDEFTAQAHIINDLHNNQIISFYAGALLDDIDIDNIVTNNNDIFILSPENKNNILKLAKELFNKKIDFIFDPGQSLSTYSKEDLLYILPKTHTLILNDFELKSMLDTIGLSFEYITDNILNIIITKGHEGVELFRDGVKAKIKAYEVKDAIDPTGCGDSFRAGFIYGIRNGFSLGESCMYGNAIASFVIEVFGTQNHKFNIEEVKKRVTVIGENS